MQIVGKIGRGLFPLFWCLHTGKKCHCGVKLLRLIRYFMTKGLDSHRLGSTRPTFHHRFRFLHLTCGCHDVVSKSGGPRSVLSNMASGLRVLPIDSSQRPAPLSACPSPESIAFPTYWYRLPDNADFLICTKCYEDKLHPTPLANLARCDYLDFGPTVEARCDFNTPRIDALIRQAIVSTDIQPLCSFAGHRLAIKSCSGVQGIKGGDGVKWFKPSNDEIPGFVCCEACYEDVVLGTVFGPNFAPYWQEQAVDQVWSCDLAVPYLKHCLQGYGRRRDWNGFVHAGRYRMSLPTCERGVAVLASAKKWYNTVRPSPIPDMDICEACYLDSAGWQDGVAPCFMQMTFSPHDFLSRKICDFRNLPLSVCSDMLLAPRTFDQWHYLASIVLSKPSCDKNAIVDGEWYGLPHPTDPSQNIENFDICAACHAGYNQSANLGHLFRRWTYSHGTSRTCDLNPSGPRYVQYLTKWNHMYFTRNPTPFIDYVSRISLLSTCQGTRALENASWYGDKDASLLICPSCFEDIVRGTCFASAFPLQRTQLSTAHHCSLYSSRMRQKYFDACNQNSLDSLLHFAAQREQIYQQTIPFIESFQASQSQKMEMLKAARNHRAASMGIAAMGNAFLGGNPFIHAYSPGIQTLTIGYEGIRRSLLNDPQRPRALELDAQWKEVE